MTHVALLRAVNVAGRNRVDMAELRDVFGGLGLTGVRSLLQSGNLVFECRDRAPASLERRLEEAAAGRLGLATDFFVRSAKEWAGLVSGNPFPREARADPARLALFCLKQAPGRDRVLALEGAITGREVMRAAGRHLYVVYPDGMGRSRLTSVLIERTLGTRGTARNWNTVLKLGALST